MYSHGQHSLTHQHWVDQVVSAGGFNVHCTQGPEASHKINMHLASLRVRHLDTNYTQDSMLEYLCRRTVFGCLRQRRDSTRPIRSRSEKPGVRNPIFLTHTISPSLKFQRSILHQEVRLSGVEFLDLLCARLSLPACRSSYTKIQKMYFQFGQKLVRQDGQVYWGTDSKYPSGNGARRDMLHLDGSEHGYALCCETICFVRITNVKSVGLDVDTLTLVVVRWLEAHPDAWQRDCKQRPVCQGPFHVNNCLWRYAKSKSKRQALVNSDTGSCSRSFNSYRHLFGKNEKEQMTCWEREQRSYYGLVSPTNILGTMNMCNTFEPNSDIPVYDTWLQTVCMS